MATNLDVGKYKNILEGTSVAPSLNFMFVPSSRNKHAVAKCCAQLGRVVERLGSGKAGRPSGRKNVMSIRERFRPDPLAGFEKMAEFQIFSVRNIPKFKDRANWSRATF